MKHDVKSIASDFIDLRIVKTTQVKDLDPSNFIQHVGIAATSIIQSLKEKAKEEDIKKFFVHCKNFLMESILQIKFRSDLNKEYHDLVECIQPQIAANLNPR